MNARERDLASRPTLLKWPTGPRHPDEPGHLEWVEFQGKLKVWERQKALAPVRRRSWLDGLRRFFCLHEWKCEYSDCSWLFTMWTLVCTKCGKREHHHYIPYRVKHP